jgi:hypothetical protein
MARDKGHLTACNTGTGSRPASCWPRPTATASRSRSWPPAWPAGSCVIGTAAGLVEARGIATLKRAEVQQGRNPAAEKQNAKATAARDWTVRDLAKGYRAKKLVSLAHG